MNIRVLGLIFILTSLAEAGFIDEANNAFSSGDYHGAIGLYKKAALTGESPALCYYNMANGYFQLDSLPQAAVYYRYCVESAPNYFKGYVNLAVVYYALNDPGRCIWAASQALGIEPGHQKSLLILAAACRRVGDLSRAIVAFEDLARRYPLMEEPFIALGEMYRGLSDVANARRWLLAAPQAGKNQDYVCLLLADIFEAEEDYDRASYYTKHALQADPTKQWTFMRLVNLYVKMGKDLVALEEAQIGVKRYPAFAELALTAGTICYNHERFEEARRYYQQAATLGSAAGIQGLSNVKQVLGAE